LVKKERNFKKAVDKWVWHGFDNPARSDHLVLHHWTKVKETEEPYPFSRFNRKIEVIRYTDEEYTIVNEKLKSQAGGLAIVTDWSKEETDHLFDLCEQFSLRFIVIADRFGLSTFTPYPGPSDSPLKKREAKAAEKEEKKYAPKFHERTVDEIKDRYYSVARAVLELRGLSDHPLLKKPPFSYEQEVKRKCNNEKLFMRTKEQHEKEKTFVAELKKLESRIKKEEKEERNFRKLVYSDTAFTVPPAQENGSL
jgi:DNA methyltransferase 1-associated protein 1